MNMLRLKMFFDNLRAKLTFDRAGATDHIRFGQIKGHAVNIGQSPGGTGGLLWAASQVVGNHSGKFVYMNDGLITLCLDATAQIFGWANEYARTPTVSTPVTGGINVALDAVYRIPVNSGTFAVGMIGDLCDISVAVNSVFGANTQGAQLNASVENSLIIVGGDLTSNHWVDVKINPAVQGAALGADA